MPARPAGLWDLLPPELLDMILDLCCPKKLAMLETSCSFFRKTKMIQTVAETRLRAIPRAKGTTPASKSVQFNQISLTSLHVSRLPSKQSEVLVLCYLPVLTSAWTLLLQGA